MKLTKEQIEFIKSAHKESCLSWQLKIQEQFPDLIKNKVEQPQVYYLSWA